MTKKDKDNNNKRTPMQNITINIPDNYDENIKLLVEKGLVANRSEAIRIALGEFLHKEYNLNLELLDFFNKNKE
ncbi:MAG: type II toxin-antitoxin system ParD family antitoxin [Candidatus Lokiarchaeota archaeon]|nr:type II toxin-antitoxin system ParD family antitoxin [Candidatus Lokiarchaeota archaeon]